MVPDKFNMVDMDGIDLILMQGEEVPGLYNRLVESIAQCRYQCLYNWLFDGVVIPPSYVEMEVGLDEEVRINEGVVVTSDDVIHIYSIEPPAPEPVINPISIIENGVYTVPEGVDGFNPVSVNVPASDIIENASVFRWFFQGGTTCWGIMKKLSGVVIGQNADSLTPDISLIGDLMTVTFHGTSQSVEVLAISAIKLKVYRTGRALGPATMTEYTMSINDQQSFTQDNVYGGIYFQAEAL